MSRCGFLVVVILDSHRPRVDFLGARFSLSLSQILEGRVCIAILSSLDK